MRVLAINNYNYTQKNNRLNVNRQKINMRINEQPQDEQKEIAPAFKGGMMSVLGAIGGGLLGLAVGGPVGAFAGATLLGGIGAKQPDDLETSDGNPYYSYNNCEIYDDMYKTSHYDG